ncbi:PatB family C-S lyase [Propionivibrio sp.]|uniref:MalY/PatB family protein n=1 Tax=Propionivibrio sp. TaxID=2212460 RepID=UPI00263427F9|nr:PatB family C-S lyase [Propionivibrio sp.]
MYDFDNVIDRRNGDSLKWNKYARKDVLPLWVADMDFAAPPAVLAALEKRIAQGCLGYPVAWPALVDTVLAYLQREYAWRVEPEWLVWLPGLVTGINVACRAVDGDVLTATPVYPPFLSAPRLSGRRLAQVGLRLADGCWGWDFAAMEAALTAQTRLLLLCHPHNPVGRAWREDELAELAAFCERHDLVVCSDEIHCGLILDAGRQHIPLARINADIARRCITLMAPSKTYNIPGLGCAFAVISDTALRNRFTGVMRGIVPDVNVLGLTAAQAAYGECEDWRAALISVLRANRDRVTTAISEMRGLTMTHVEATYLAWIDARGLDVANPARFFEAAGVGLSRGDDFGLPGWVRLNFGCPRSTLDSALERMATACSARASSFPKPCR